jgi:hypothetical protein
MKKSFIAATALAIAATSASARADDAVSGQSAVSQQTQQSTAQQQTTSTAQQPPVITSTTTTTSGVPGVSGTGGAATAIDPSASTSPPEKDTVVLYQSYRPNKAYLYTGGAILLGSYVTTAAVTASENEDQVLYIPVAGPWISLADRPANEDTSTTALIIGSGVLQGVGALLTTASFFIPEKVPAATIQAGNTKIHLSPMANGRGTAGVGAFAQF